MGGWTPRGWPGRAGRDGGGALVWVVRSLGWSIGCLAWGTPHERLCDVGKGNPAREGGGGGILRGFFSIGMRGIGGVLGFWRMGCERRVAGFMVGAGLWAAVARGSKPRDAAAGVGQNGARTCPVFACGGLAVGGWLRLGCRRSSENVVFCTSRRRRQRHPGGRRVHHRCILASPGVDSMAKSKACPIPWACTSSSRASSRSVHAHGIQRGRQNSCDFTICVGSCKGSMEWGSSPLLTTPTRTLADAHGSR